MFPCLISASVDISYISINFYRSELRFYEIQSGPAKHLLNSQIFMEQGQIFPEYYTYCHFPQISGISSSINELHTLPYSKYIWPFIPQTFGLTVLITINIRAAQHFLFIMRTGIEQR